MISAKDALKECKKRKKFYDVKTGIETLDNDNYISVLINLICLHLNRSINLNETMSYVRFDVYDSKKVSILKEYLEKELGYKITQKIEKNKRTPMYGKRIPDNTHVWNISFSV